MEFVSIFANENNIFPYAEIYASKYQLPVSLIMGIIAQESGFNQYASRYESSINDTSYGLMQILYTTAHDIGFNQQPENLFDIDTNLNFGCKFLSSKYKKYNKNLYDTISAYNGGSTKKLSNGTYKNQDYINKVLSYYLFYNAKFVELNELKSNNLKNMILNKQFTNIVNLNFGKISEKNTKDNILPIILIALPIIIKLYKKVF